MSLSVHRVHRKRLFLLHFCIYQSYLAFYHLLFLWSCLTRLINLRQLIKRTHIPDNLSALNSRVLELLAYLILFLLLFLKLHLLLLKTEIIRRTWQKLLLGHEVMAFLQIHLLFTLQQLPGQIY